MALFVYPVEYEDPAQMFAAFQAMPYSLLLDSALAGHDGSNFSYIAFMPLETVETFGEVTTITNREQQFVLGGNPFGILKGRLELYQENTEYSVNLPAFQGGVAGMFGYDLGRSLESLPDIASADSEIPDMAVGIYNQVIALDHKKRIAQYMIQCDSEGQSRFHLAHLRKLLENAGPAGMLDTPEPEWVSNMSREEYERKVEKILCYIRAGEIFQANFSQRFEAERPPGFDPYSHYLNLRRVNAAPFASYMNLGNIKISSASPERFIKMQGRGIETRPVKGTRPRMDDVDVDQLIRNQLENSEKDRAENTMIVDLLRNDLSKVCEDHSIDVPVLCKLESFARVHHLVSTITGSLRIDKSPLDLLQACFPGGSITGCPKIRAMEIIEELEPERRGPYCGSIGYIGFNGNMDTSIAIRTLVYKENTVSFNVGGGIVADSDPEAEYRETFDKAEAIFQSFKKPEKTIEKYPAEALA